MSDWWKHIDQNWTLFLDRDGVINQKIENDYVKSIDHFTFLPGVFDALAGFNHRFGPIVVVTNQQGIGKEIMTEEDLALIHQHMLREVRSVGGRIDSVLHCPGLEKDQPECRKPNTGMAFQALAIHPTIDFKRAVMVGDSESDMEFGRRLGLNCVRIGDSDPRHLSLPSLVHFAQMISS